MIAIWREARSFGSDLPDRSSVKAWILQRIDAEIMDTVKRKRSEMLKNLLARIVDEDHAALEELRRAVAGDIRKFAEYKGLSRHDAEDVVQDVCIVVWKDASRFRGETAPSAWIMRIARNKINDWWREHGEQRRLSSSLSEFEDGFDDFVDPNPGIDPEKCAENSASLKHISGCLAKLPYKYRDYLIKAYQFELPLKEISQLWRCPEGTIKSGLSTARELMKKCLERRGIAP